MRYISSKLLIISTFNTYCFESHGLLRFKVRFNCRIVATKTMEEIIIIIIIIIAFWLLRKLTEIPVSPGLTA